MLLDPEILAKITPGVKTLEPTEDGKFNIVSSVKLGPVNGSFKGHMEVSDQVKPERFTLHMKQTSKIGNVNATGSIALKTIEGNQTEVAFDGDAKLSGTLARTGQRVLSGVARTMTNQFFSSLEKEINAVKPAEEIKKDTKGLWARLMAWLKRLFGAGE
jgi:carbon monoxide dehydrogenase subunit G